MIGRIFVIAIVVAALGAGASMYYLQVYRFYEDVSATVSEVRLVTRDGNTRETIDARDITAIDADSSPIRFRACFTTMERPEALAERFEEITRIDPRNGPAWFGCFDAAAIAKALDAGTARAFLAEKNVEFGADRIVAITDDGHGYIWHDLNDCDEKAYDGTVIGEACPPRPGAVQ